MNSKVRRILNKPFLKNLDENSRFFLRKSLENIYEHNFSVKFYKNAIRSEINNGYSGEVDIYDRVVRVGHVDNEIDYFDETSWFAIYIHEYCHFLQFLEDKNAFDGIKYYKKAAQIEFDCEKRVINQIKKYNLPINQENYKIEANAHVCLYYCKPFFKNPIKDKYTKKLLHLMPARFSLDFEKFVKNNYEFLETQVFST